MRHKYPVQTQTQSTRLNDMCIRLSHEIPQDLVTLRFQTQSQGTIFVLLFTQGTL